MKLLPQWKQMLLGSCLFIWVFKVENNSKVSPHTAHGKHPFSVIIKGTTPSLYSGLSFLSCTIPKCSLNRSKVSIFSWQSSQRRSEISIFIFVFVLAKRRASNFPCSLVCFFNAVNSTNEKGQLAQMKEPRLHRNGQTFELSSIIEALALSS